MTTITTGMITGMITGTATGTPIPTVTTTPMPITCILTSCPRIRPPTCRF